ncbi:uncharacterized protein LOC130663153 [Microplitis mediator]|uniref:uncharacterized protein LOC130663153 n=1 Tax=Microplitis mediator TaxID=375433 RepID=UPI002557ADFD|nr:uncharacterized protein LOC130663153 [Microplitis mediator]
MSSLINQRVSLINKNNDLIKQIEQLKILCFSNNQPNTSSQKIIIKKSLKLMSAITKPSNLLILKNLNPQDYLSCSIKLMFICHQDIFLRLNNPCKIEYTKNYQLSKIYYYHLLNVFIAGRNIQEVVDVIIKLININNLWQWEYLSGDVIHGLFKLNVDTYYILNYLLDIIDLSSNYKNHDNISRDILNIINTLYNNKYTWTIKIKTLTSLERLLDMYHNLIIDSTLNLIKNNNNVKNSLYILLHNIIKNLPNNYLLLVIKKMCSWIIYNNEKENIKNMIFEIENIVEYTAKNYKLHLITDMINDKLFNCLMEMISSSNRKINLLGNRIFQQIIDRNNNKKYFLTPKIFYETTNYSIKINKECKSECEFFKNNRILIHDTLLSSLMKHAVTKVNLESTYCSICLLAVEIPSGFTAAALICLVMNIQELTLQSINSKINRKVSYHIHATVMAVITLICRIYNAKILYNYVNKVMMERAQWAPHLNPPLKNNYVFAIHYVLWNKSELFFVDWEARFGLWKCFRKNIYDHDNATEK